MQVCLDETTNFGTPPPSRREVHSPHFLPSLRFSPSDPLVVVASEVEPAATSLSWVLAPVLVFVVLVVPLFSVFVCPELVMAVGLVVHFVVRIGHSYLKQV